MKQEINIDAAIAAGAYSKGVDTPRAEAADAEMGNTK